VSSVRGTLHISLRQLCALAPGRERATSLWKQELQQAFYDLELETSIPLLEAQLDHPIGIYRRSRVSRIWEYVSRVSSSLGKWVVAAISLAAAIVALAPVVWSTGGVEKMRGGLNILIAPFQLPSGREKDAETFSVASGLRQTVERERESVAPVIAVRAGDMSATSESQAADLADENGAQIVIYGSVERDGPRWLARPYIFVRPRWLTGAEELGGVYPLNRMNLGALAIERDVAGRTLLGREVTTEVDALSQFAVGLSWFQAGRWARAISYFRMARIVNRDPRLRQMILLFEGNAEGRKGNFSEASRSYDRALISDPGWQRARLGLTEIKLHEAQGDCTRTVDGDRLRAVAQNFAGLAGEKINRQPIVRRAIELRADLGRARAELCLSQARVASKWEVSIRDFRRVLQLGAPFKLQFASELAEAHAGLGLAFLPSGPHALGAGPAFGKALRQFEKAERLAVDPFQRDAFRQMRSFIERRLQRLKDAKLT
jgi:tetratricopeptide (TPR) repeat protein